MMQQVFFQLISQYSNDQLLANEIWDEIEKKYSHKKRHYHTMQHLENLLLQLAMAKPLLQDWNTILFSLFYHDIVYNSLRSDNEEKSALLAEKRMTQLGVPTGMVIQCKEQVLATKLHTISSDSDTNYFTDADLSVLGQPWQDYKTYFQQVRKEYAIYPDIIYKPGRKKVLEHFLSMDHIFKTDFYRGRYEEQARQNLQEELTSLT